MQSITIQLILAQIIIILGTSRKKSRFTERYSPQAPSPHAARNEKANHKKLSSIKGEVNATA